MNNYLHTTENGYIYGVWAISRPMTKHWGSGQIWNRICESFGDPDVAFGKTDGIPHDILAIDKDINFDWIGLPYPNNNFKFGYWDPPYDKLYKKEGQEIWRTCKKLAILHTHIYPTSWFENATRIAGVAITMGPLKQTRMLQIFKK